MSLSQALEWASGFEEGELEAAECFKNLAAFTKRAWREIDPAPLIWNWHMDAVCEHLQAVTDGEINQLIINIPPGCAKSMMVSVMWPAWTWIRKPSWKALFSSYEMGLVSRDMTKRRALMDSPWYQHWFRNTESSPFTIPGWEFADDQNTKTYYKNNKLGEFTGLSVGQGTGKRGDALVIDDPIDADAAKTSKVERDGAIRWKTETMSTRFNELAKAQQVLIMQRLHDDDLTGYLLRNEPGMWQHLCLMSKFEPKRRSTTYTNSGKQLFTDPRKEEGEILFPALFPDPVLNRLKVSLGSYGFAGQHQQSPAPAEGGLLKREWYNRRWYIPGRSQPVNGLTCVPLPAQFDLYGMFTDAAFKKTEDSDFVAIGLFGLKWPNLYLLDLRWDRMTFTETVSSILDLYRKWTKPPFITVSGVYVEDKANGTAVMDTLRAHIPGIIPMEPDGGKEARILAASPKIEAGNLIIPLDARWVSDYIEEAASFPKGSHDDATDMTAYAVRKMLGGMDLSHLDALGKM